MYIRMAFQYPNGYGNYTQVTPSCTQICADHTTTTKPQWETELVLPPCHPLHCLAFHQWCWQWGWDDGATGYPVPVATLQPNTKPCPTTGAWTWKHFFSLLFKHKAPSHKRRHSGLQKVSVHGLPWISCIHQLALCLELLPLWLQIRQNTEQEPDINLSCSKEIFSSKMSRRQKTSLLLTRSSHSGWLYLTSRQLSAPAWNVCARGCLGTCWCAQMASSTGWEMQSFFHQVHYLVSMRGLLREVRGEQTPVFPLNSAKGKLKTS